MDDLDKKAFNAACQKHGHTDGYSMIVAHDIWQAALEWRDSQAGEPVAWYTEDHSTDKSATTWSKETAERWKYKGWPVCNLYPAPPIAQINEQLVEALESILNDGIHSDVVPHLRRKAEDALKAAKEQS